MRMAMSARRVVLHHVHQAARIRVVQRRCGRGNTIVIGRPPNFVRAGVGSRLRERGAIDVGDARDDQIRTLPIARKLTRRVVIIVDGDADLVQIVLTLRARGGVTYFLHGRNEQRDQNADNGNDHK